MFDASGSNSITAMYNQAVWNFTNIFVILQNTLMFTYCVQEKSLLHPSYESLT